MPDAGDPQGTSTWTRLEGDQLHARSFGDGDRGVLLVHGLQGESRELGALPPAIADRGFTVLAVDLRGHGKSAGPRARLTRQRVLDELAVWRDTLDDQGTPFAAIGGHSLGAAWALAAAPRIEPEALVAACVPASIRAELSHVEEAGYRLGAGVHRLARRFGADQLSVPYKVAAGDVLDDPESIRRMEADGLIQPKVPLANVEPLLAVDAVAWAREVQCPGLIAAARDDRVVAQGNTRAVYNAYAGPKDWIELPGPHSCFYDAGSRKRCADEVADWLVGVLASR